LSVALAIPEDILHRLRLIDCAVGSSGRQRVVKLLQFVFLFSLYTVVFVCLRSQY
jgi:hypothetical protein